MCKREAHSLYGYMSGFVGMALLIGKHVFTSIQRRKTTASRTMCIFSFVCFVFRVQHDSVLEKICIWWDICFRNKLHFLLIFAKGVNARLRFYLIKNKWKYLWLIACLRLSWLTNCFIQQTQNCVSVHETSGEKNPQTHIKGTHGSWKHRKMGLYLAVPLTSHVILC